MISKSLGKLLWELFRDILAKFYKDNRITLTMLRYTVSVLRMTDGDKMKIFTFYFSRNCCICRTESFHSDLDLC